MSNRQLEQLRETLDSIFQELCNREQAVDKEQAHLSQRQSELDQRQSHLKSLDDIVAQHQATELQLTDKLQSLVDSLDARSAAQPQWMTGALEAMEQRIVERIQAEQAAQPAIGDIVREVERVQSRSVQSLVEQLTISLQTAMAVQLAPLTDELPERLTSALANSTPASPLSTPELARELEKFESRSMASLAARMSAGLQTALASQWDLLIDGLPDKLAAIMTKSQSGLMPATTGAHKQDQASEKHYESKLEKLSKEHATQIDALNIELEKTKNSLSEAELLLSEALEHAPTKSDTPATGNEEALIVALRDEITDLRKLLAAKEYDSRVLEELREELNQLRSNTNGNDSGKHLDEDLRERLELATCEIVDLRTQNEELNERVTRLQISTAAHVHMPHLGQEGLSWEERKKLLLAQLDAEQNGDEPESAAARRLEVDDILKTTDAELARRDREIAELRSLLEQQADAREGVAVGAAAVAQMIESDELVQEEREKLRAMQKSWEEKFRQSEIELSMERAKLARERLQMEEQKQELEAALHAAAQNASLDPKADPKGRKWLSRLGLKEEK